MCKRILSEQKGPGGLFLTAPMNEFMEHMRSIPSATGFF